MQKLKRYLIIDDDPIFLEIIKRCADARKIQVETFESLEALGSVGRLAQYDAAIIDYDLGCLTGVDIGRYLQSLLPGKPMLLCSASAHEQPESGWPSSVRGFMPKNLGHQRLLDELIKL